MRSNRARTLYTKFPLESLHVVDNLLVDSFDSIETFDPSRALALTLILAKRLLLMCI
jgi:hypothetical protein